jgi:creatinine amidohydrolase
MTAKQIAALPDKAWAPVILATGAIEQHGPHLPVAVDAFLGQCWVEGIYKKLNPNFSFYVAPPVTVGKSNEHVGFPGTLIISKETLRNQVWTVARQIHAWGFQQLVILNTHGGNTAVTHYTLREIRAELGLRAGPMQSNFKFDISEQEEAYGFHANEAETALLSALAPQYVHMDRAVCHYPAKIEDPGELRPECAPATYSWASQDISPSGIMGNAPIGTPDKGHRWYAGAVDGMVQHLTTLCAEARRRAGV